MAEKTCYLLAADFFAERLHLQSIGSSWLSSAAEAKQSNEWVRWCVVCSCKKKAFNIKNWIDNRCVFLMQINLKTNNIHRNADRFLLLHISHQFSIVDITKTVEQIWTHIHFLHVSDNALMSRPRSTPGGFEALQLDSKKRYSSLAQQPPKTSDWNSPLDTAIHRPCAWLGTFLGVPNASRNPVAARSTLACHETHERARAGFDKGVGGVNSFWFEAQSRMKLVCFSSKVVDISGWYGQQVWISHIKALNLLRVLVLSHRLKNNFHTYMCCISWKEPIQFRKSC